MEFDFDSILYEICNYYNVPWYDVIDGEFFEEFENAVVDEYGEGILATANYNNWLQDIIDEI